MDLLRTSRWLILGALVVLPVLMGILIWNQFKQPSLSEAELTPSAPTPTYSAAIAATFTALARPVSSFTPTLPSGDKAPTLYPEPDSISTLSAEDVRATDTAGASLTQSALLTPPVSGYPYPSPAATSALTPAAPVPTASITALPVTLTPAPTATLSYVPQLPCNLAEFVTDKTYPDGAPVFPGEVFIKVWTVRNGGTCTWDTRYEFVYERGDRMDTKLNIPFSSLVPPNTFADLSITFQAPSSPGMARSYWLIRSNRREKFGTGIQRDQELFVKVEVRQPRDTMKYDMATNACLARWRSRSGVLPCQGLSTSSTGSIVLLEKPLLEGERLEDELTLWTRPGTFVGAFITGTYPEFVVATGDRFMAQIGCLFNNPDCELSFSVGYQAESGGIRTLAEYAEESDEKLTTIDLDLSELAGQTIRLVLSVRNRGRADQANGFWLAPGVRNTTNP